MTDGHLQVDAPSRPGWGWAWVIPGLVIVAALMSAVLLLTRAGDPLEPGALAAKLPADGVRQVTVRATVEQTARFPKSAPDGAFLARGDGGGRLLVIPRKNAALEPAPRGATVTIRGQARAPRKVADGRYLESPPLTPSELADRTNADVVIAADEVILP